VAIFIADLAFLERADLGSAKLAIISSSALAGILGYALLRRVRYSSDTPS
jgi:Na+/H+ antiporter NhaA